MMSLRRPQKSMYEIFTLSGSEFKMYTIPIKLFVNTPSAKKENVAVHPIFMLTKNFNQNLSFFYKILNFINLFYLKHSKLPADKNP